MKRFIALSLVFLIFVCCFSGCKQQVITIEEEIEVSDSDITDASDNESETEKQSPSDNKPTGNSGEVAKIKHPQQVPVHRHKAQTMAVIPWAIQKNLPNQHTV